MNDRIKQFRVGVVVLATSLIGGILVTLNGPALTGWIPGVDKHYQVTIELPEAPGIGPDTPIRKNGLLIGRVADIEDLQDHVAVKANIDAGRLLYQNYEVQVRTTLLGDATVEFVTAPVPPGTPPVASGAVFQGKVAPSPLSAITDLQGDMKSMIDSLKKAGDEVSKLAETVNTAIGPDPEAGRVPKLLDTAERSMADLSRAAQTFDKFFGDPELMSTVREARMTMNDVRDVASKVQSPIESIDRNLKNLEGFTEPLGRNGEQVSTSLIDALSGLSRIVEELTVLTEALNNREGTIGLLIHNPQVYNNLNLLLCNSNQVVLQISGLTQRLRPVVDDARVFMDKIAREPGRVVSGAFSNSPGIK
jgi:phospholipid/cholesterol/gamma-HCH transport system substrate-binding protein